MSQGGSVSVAWLFMGLCALVIVSSWLSPAVWLCAAVLIWLAPLAYPTDLKRPRGLGAWMLWAAWSLVAALFCREPMIAAAALWPGATGVLVFALAYSWWGRPHRRAWLAGVWILAAALGADALRRGSCSAVAAAFLAAALGSCLSAGAGVVGSAEKERMRWAARLLAPFYLALGGAIAWRSREALVSAWALARRLWEAGGQIALARPVSGVGPGLFERGFLLFAEVPGLSGPQVSSGAQWSRAAAETGLVGLSLFVVAVAFSRPRFFRSHHSQVRGSSREWERRAAAGAFWALGAFSLFEEIFARQALLCLWFTALACAAPGTDEEESRSFRLHRGAALAGGALCLLCAWPKLYVAGSLSANSLPRLYAAAALAPGDAALHVEIARRGLLLDPPQIGAAISRLDEAIAASPREALYLERKAELFKILEAWPEARRWESEAARLREAQARGR